jgi:hypothetical protein
MKLVPLNEKVSNGAVLEIWEGPISNKSCWWYLKLDDDAVLQCPNIGKAPMS